MDKHCVTQKGQAANKDCDILDTLHKVARYIDGSLQHSQNGCQICSTRVDNMPEWTQLHILQWENTLFGIFNFKIKFNLLLKDH